MQGIAGLTGQILSSTCSAPAISLPFALQVLAGVAPPLSARYSLDLQALIDAMLQPTPAARPTVDEILATLAVRPLKARPSQD